MNTKHDNDFAFLFKSKWHVVRINVNSYSGGWCERGQNDLTESVHDEFTAEQERSHPWCGIRDQGDSSEDGGYREGPDLGYGGSGKVPSNH